MTALDSPHVCACTDPLAHPSVLAAALAEWNRIFGYPSSPWPTADIDPDVIELRKRLLTEECEELIDAIDEGDILAIAKEAADLAYVLQGTADAFGFSLDDAVTEVHASNMSKLGPDGKPIRDEHGKTLKGPNYRPADMAKALGLAPAASGPQVAGAAA